jgi:hypothetical protein
VATSPARSYSASAQRAAVHLALIVTATVSLVLEPTLSVHIVFGLSFAAFVLAHLGQRRRVSRTLIGRLVDANAVLRPSGRLAVSDTLLLVLTVAMLASGLWDWLAPHPTKIRWHAITGVLLTGYLIAHTVRRRHRLVRSRVR